MASERSRRRHFDLLEGEVVAFLALGATQLSPSAASRTQGDVWWMPSGTAWASSREAGEVLAALAPKPAGLVVDLGVEQGTLEVTIRHSGRSVQLTADEYGMKQLAAMVGAASRVARGDRPPAPVAPVKWTPADWQRFGKPSEELGKIPRRFDERGVERLVVGAEGDEL
jgi:hypothetical protein